MEKHIYLIRHGETDFNQLGIVQGSGVDTSLNGNGLEQAQLFYQKYKSVEFDLLITSALKRSQETVRFFEHQVPRVLRDGRINEINWGVSEGKKSNPESVEAYRAMLKAWGEGDLSRSLQNGESAQSLIDRCDHFISDLVERSEERILVCSHGRTMRCLVTRLLGWGPSEMENVHHANTGLYQFRYDGNFNLILRNDTSHLC